MINIFSALIKKAKACFFQSESQKQKQNLQQRQVPVQKKKLILEQVESIRKQPQQSLTREIQRNRLYQIQRQQMLRRRQQQQRYIQRQRERIMKLNQIKPKQLPGGIRITNFEYLNEKNNQYRRGQEMQRIDRRANRDRRDPRVPRDDKDYKDNRDNRDNRDYMDRSDNRYQRQILTGNRSQRDRYNRDIIQPRVRSEWQAKIENNNNMRRENISDFENQILSQDENEIEKNDSIYQLVINQNKLICNYQRPQKSIKIRNYFVCRRGCDQYLDVLIPLLKYEIITNVNQSIQKKTDTKPEFQNPIKGKIKEFKKKFQQWLEFMTEKQSDKIKLAKNLMKGQKVCIISLQDVLTQQTTSQNMNVCKICLIGYQAKGEKFVITTSDYLNFIDKNIFLFELDPIVTAKRAMAALNFVQKSLHRNQILNPKISIPKIKNTVRQEIQYQQIMKIVQKKRNQSQTKTIKDLVSFCNGIHLVQGPPGTGKTSTILNFLSVELSCLRFQKKIVMVCSESNAAIDDIATKIKQEGLIWNNANREEIIRLGQVCLASRHLIQFNLRHKCQKRMFFGTKTSVELQLQIEEMEYEISSNSNHPSLRQLKKKIQENEKRIFDRNNQIRLESKQFQEIQQNLLQNAKILLSTLSASGRNQIVNFFRDRIGCLIIDQACQTTEPNILIPFLYQPQKVVLVGDPKQLEPTVISRSKQSGYSRSLFQRITHCGVEPALLNTQYRMVPQISEFSNKHMYFNLLKNGRTTGKPKSFQNLKESFRSSSILFLDISYGKQQLKSKSYENQEEAKIIAQIAEKFNYLDSDLTIGIISPYSSQTKALQNQIIREIPSIKKRNNIKVSTVDAFQGQQRDIIIITCVRANQKGEIGFLNNERRLNVALTRAKNALIVVGNEKTLTKDALWKNYIEFNKNRNRFHSFQNYKNCRTFIRELFLPHSQ